MVDDRSRPPRCLLLGAAALSLALMLSCSSPTPRATPAGATPTALILSSPALVPGATAPDLRTAAQGAILAQGELRAPFGH